MVSLNFILCIHAVVFATLHQEARAFSVLQLTSSRPIRQVSAPYPPHLQSRHSSTSLNRQPTKWDFLEDDDEEGEKIDYTPCPLDMTYVERNLVRAHKSFLAIRNAGGPALTNDVYARDGDSEVFFYIGKVARVSDVSLDDCMSRQWSMIERHAGNLRPTELFPLRGKLQLWTAPGDSELDVAYNRPQIRFVKHIKRVYGTPEYPKHVKVGEVGFQGETYEGGTDGFRTWRTDDGLPARSEINPDGPTEPLSIHELSEVYSELNRQGINAGNNTEIDNTPQDSNLTS